MTLAGGALILVPALALGAAMACGWMLWRRPLAVLAWGARLALKRCGLKRTSVPSPAGLQNVFVGGTGPVLVLLHGAGDQAGTWARVAPALVPRYTLVIPDLAGHGASAPAAGPIETGAVVAGLEAVLAALAPERPAVLVGNSLGAWMAMVLAARHPGRVERVVAVNGGPLKGEGATVNLLPRNREEARETLARTRGPFARPVPDPILDDVVRQAREGPLARFAATAAGMGPWLLDEAQLRILRLPVRLIWGGSDQLMPLDYARRMLAALPDAQLFTIDQCGHLPQQEAPGPFLAALGQALQTDLKPGASA